MVMIDAAGMMLYLQPGENVITPSKIFESDYDCSLISLDECTSLVTKGFRNDIGKSSFQPFPI